MPNKDDDETDFVFFISLPAWYDEREYDMYFLTGNSFSLHLGPSKVVLTFMSLDKISRLSLQCFGDSFLFWIWFMLRMKGVISDVVTVDICNLFF